MRFKTRRKITSLRLLLICWCCLVIGACSSQDETFAETLTDYASNLSEPNVSVRIAGLTNCTDYDSGKLRLNSKEPVTVIIHGCFSSAGRFRSMAEVFEFHGQQTICFSYDDRERLTTSAMQLKEALANLAQVLENPEITLIGHSQGGLISRRALVSDPVDDSSIDNVDFKLATISSPFGGIEAASHCSSTTAAWLSLGIVKLMCRAITGRKYQDIPPNSPFIEQPGNLLPSVGQHLKIVTDEADTCRVDDGQGTCIEDDFVFSVNEQYQQIVDSQSAIVPLEIKAGHVEIVGDGGQVPQKLIEILQQQEFLRATPPAAKQNLATLLARIYLREKGDGG